MSDLLLALLKGLLTKVALEEFGSASAGVARTLVKWSARWLLADRQRYEEQWLADLEDRKTPLRKLLFAIGLLRAVAVLRRESRHLEKSREETQWSEEDWVFDAAVIEPTESIRRKVSLKRRRTEPGAYRDPLVVVDESIEALTYLAEWIVEDFDLYRATEFDLLAKHDIRSLAALRVIRAALPRLRILRSNYQGAPTLPDATLPPPDAEMYEFVERSRAELRRRLGIHAQTIGKPADEPNEAGSETNNKPDGA